jgi:hypothetical protein
VPLPLCIVLSEPHAPAVLHIGALQVTPWLEASNATVAVRFAVVKIGTVTLVGWTLTEIGMIVTLAVTDLVGSVKEVAVIVTGAGGIDVGAVYVIKPVLAVCVGMGRPDCKEPQAGAAAPQLKLQLTPAAFASLVTVAPSEAVEGAAAVLTPKSAGGGVEIFMVIGSGAIGRVTPAEMEGSLAATALIVTVLPTGNMGGAVYTVDAP